MPTCGGLVDSLCQPCPDGGPEGFCQAMIDECSKIFCTPMCKRTTWTCKLDFGGFAQEAAEQERYEDALCAHFINEGCSTILDCCPRDDFLRQDVADKVNRDMFPVPALPTPGCVHDPAGKGGADLCSKCNSEVKVELEKKECAFPPTPGPGPSFLETGSRLRNVKDRVKGKPRFSKPDITLEEVYEHDEMLLLEIESHAEMTNKRAATTTTTSSSSSSSKSLAKSMTPISDRDNARASVSMGANLAIQELNRMFEQPRSRASKLHVASQRAAAAAATSAGTNSLLEGKAQLASKATVEAKIKAGASTDVDAEAGGELETADADSENANPRRFGEGTPGFPGKPTYFGLNDRCNKLAERVEGMFGGMTSTFQEKVCNCMGCCVAEGEPTCFFPLWEVIASAPGEGKEEASFIEQSSYYRKLRRENRWAKHWAKVRAENAAAEQNEKQQVSTESP